MSTAEQFPRVDFEQLRQHLEPAQLVPQWLAGGKPQGREWVARNPTRQDAKPGSFSVNLNTGAWSDFATGDKGGDLISLWAYLHHHGKQINAARDLAERYRLDSSAPAVPAPAPAAAPLTKPDRLLMPAPDTAATPSEQERQHYQYGQPARQWAYRDAAGRVLFYICRFEPEGARKQVLPLTYRQDSKGTGWRWKGISGDTPRPLYGLDRLAARPDAAVLIVEGEKAADAAAEHLPDLVAVTWMGGTSATGKADLAPLAGRRIIIWPDADEPGHKAAADLLQRLTGVAAELALITPPTDRPAGWDSADATPEEARQLLEAAKAPAPALPYGFKRKAGGIWYQDPADEQEREHWVCSDLEITALTRDHRNENHGYLLEFKDMDQHPHSWAMPAELLAGSGDEYRRVLLSKGLTIAPGFKARQLLAQYIQTCRPTARARCVQQTGWHQGAYVLPNEVLGHSTDRLLFQSTTGDVNGYDTAGTLESWRTEVSQYCRGNSRLLLAVSAALAAPMLALIHAEGGGFHLRGYSSTGKTTALAVAASVWGPPERIRRWRSTGNGLEGTAALHNDALLCLDELAELPAKDAGNVAYMLANGQGKARASRSGELRQPNHWRTLFLSTGEISLADHMSTAGDRARAGQEVRIIDLSADAGAGFGLFDTLHDHTGGEHLSRRLVDRSAHHHGTAARAFIRKLAAEQGTVTDWVDRTRQHFTNNVIPAGADGQVKRVADRFALVTAAGELATYWGITGWDRGEAAKAAKRCFGDWLEHRGGAGSQEDKQALEQVRAFFQINGASRFASSDSDTVHNRAGYVRNDNGERHYLVFPEVFRQEICKGLDPQRVARLLVDTGHLVTDGQHVTKKIRLEDGSRPRLYMISAGIVE